MLAWIRTEQSILSTTRVVPGMCSECCCGSCKYSARLTDPCQSESSWDPIDYSAFPSITYPLQFLNQVCTSTRRKSCSSELSCC